MSIGHEPVSDPTERVETPCGEHCACGSNCGLGFGSRTKREKAPTQVACGASVKELGLKKGLVSAVPLLQFNNLL